MNGVAYKKAETKRKASELTASIRLEFEPKDIKYIIIKDDSEVLEFLQILRSTKGKYSYEDVERLTTRIITVEQIISDF